MGETKSHERDEELEEHNMASFEEDVAAYMAEKYPGREPNDLSFKEFKMMLARVLHQRGEKVPAWPSAEGS